MFPDHDFFSRNTFAFSCLACFTVLPLAADASRDVCFNKKSCRLVLGGSDVLFGFMSSRLNRSTIVSTFFSK